jgi:glycosyltransferase involved in cell wall biosynthesis
MGSPSDEQTVKILIVHNQYQQPGGEDVVFEQEKQMLQRHGHQVAIYCRNNHEVDSYSGLKRISLVKQTIWASDSREAFARLLDQEKPDVVHVHNTFIMVSPSIFSVCEENHIPIVHSLHNYRLFCPAGTFYRDGKVCEECVEHSLLRSLRYRCYRNSFSATAVTAGMLRIHRSLETWTKPMHHYIALSGFARGRFVNSGLPADKIFVKPNFVHPDPGLRADKEDYAIFVGRLSPEKRVGVLLGAWERTSSRFPLLILGGGPEREELQETINRNGLHGIQLPGHMPREQVVAAIGKARFLVFCSEWYENFPVTMVEAFACGTPVICSRLGAMEEIVTDGQTGLHFAPGDSDDLAKKMDWAWAHPKEMSAMGQAARQEFETKYTADINYDLLMEIYRKAGASAA